MGLKSGDIVTNEEAMDLAIDLARRGLGRVSPNPPVGCVIVNKCNAVIGLGYHKEAGQNHAEIEAIGSVSNPSELEGASLFVTLEPCSHYGRTPPCTEALGKIKLSKVYYAIDDPNPKVNGEGLKKLAAEGVKVVKMDSHAKKAAELSEVFLHNMVHEEPFVALKVATSLDGKLALKTGQSQWITGEEAREKSHHLRSIYDAVVIGVGTFIEDNPSLDIRFGELRGKSNTAVVLDPMGRGLSKLEESNIFSLRNPEQIIWVVGQHCQVSNKKVQMLKCATSSGGFLLSSLLKELYAMGFCSLFVEGGAKTLSSFVRQKSAHRLYQFVAPLLIGGEHGMAWTQYWGADHLDHCPRLLESSYEKVGEDLLFSGRFQPLIL